MNENPYKLMANWIINDLKALLRKRGLTIEHCPLKPEAVGFLARRVSDGVLTKAKARELLAKWFVSGIPT